MTKQTPGARARARLTHPVVDADGHSQEFLPAIDEYLAKQGISAGVHELIAGLLGPDANRWSELSLEERRHVRAMRPPWWATPTRNTLDFATATVPRLLESRLDELGIDFAVVYPTLALGFPSIQNDELRGAACRALNTYHAELYAEHRRQLTPVALVPMHTPEEAIAELEHCVSDLGLRAILIPSYVSRPIEFVAERAPDCAPYAQWLDTFGIDSAHDYDPFWRRCEELGVSLATHGSGMGWGSRRSISSYMYNHVGHFAAAGEALCKSLFMGGVTRRFPKLRFAFLEGGVAWACAQLSDQLGHWRKRNGAMLGNYDPAALDRALLGELFERYAGDRGWSVEGSGWVMRGARGEAEDEWAALEVSSEDELVELFVPRFFFGCEADDPMTSMAFNAKVNPFGVRLGAMLGSDIGHWDVPDMREVLPEVLEPLDEGWISQEDLRDFAFANVVRFYTDTNPAFFEGTSVESAVRALLAEG
ncbi:MAG: amidohydrolase family protein [Deltaproteobacteria bacterium]|jgi:predicted TIM-barrel fold metal-dependent hydrolase|nr:amidohydrolase family protein [Deltaproteobacteria bacterium]